MPRVMVKVDEGSLDGVIQKLNHLREDITRKAVRKGLNAAGKKVSQSAKRVAPVESPVNQLAAARSGTYRKSIGLRVKIYRGGERAVAVIGPRRGFRKLVGFRKRGHRAWLPVFHDPAKIAHLVERKRHVMRLAGNQAPGELADAMIQAVNEVLAGYGYTL